MSGPRRGRQAGRDAGREAGFTIVEVLVAFAIAALGTLIALQIAAGTVAGIRRLAALRVEADEAEIVCLQRVAAGPLQEGLSEGSFSNGRPWTLLVTDARPAYGMPRGAFLWRLRLTRGDPSGATIYTTLVPGRLDG